MLALLAIVLAAAGCGGGSSDEGTLNVGQLGATEVTKALLEEAGEADTPYKVSYSLYPAGGPAFLEAVPSGSVDLAGMADTPPIFGQASGSKTKIVAAASTLKPGQSMVEILTAKDSGLRSVADLKGKKVATTEATILQYTLVRALEEAGLSYSDVEVVNLAPPDAMAAFERGDVDAVTALDPQLAQLKARGAVKIGDGVNTTSGRYVFVATDAALADSAKTKLVEDYLKRTERAERWADENPDKWAEVYAKVQGLDPKIARAIIAREKFTMVPLDQKVIKDQQTQADVFTDLKLIPKKLDVAAEFDDRFNAALDGNAQ